MRVGTQPITVERHTLWERITFSLLVVFCLCHGAGTLHAQSSTSPISVKITSSQLFGTKGSPTDALVTKAGFVLVSVTDNGGPGTGVQVFQPSYFGGYVNPCGQQIIRFPQLLSGQDIKSVQGIKLLPEYPPGAMSIGAAVERFGGEFARLVNLRTCAIDGVVNVPQKEVKLPPDCPQSGGEYLCSPGSFDLAVTTPKIQSPNVSHAFIANEYGVLPPGPTPVDIRGSGTIGVITVVRDAEGKFTSGTRPILVGNLIYVEGGAALPGITISNDEKWLFVTSENTTADEYQNPTNIPSNSTNFSIQVSGNCVNKPGGGGVRNGLLTIIDVQKAIAGLGQAAVKRRMASGCSPVRVVQTSDNKVIWVAARGDDRVLAYDVDRLVSDSDSIANTALIGYANTGGTAPVGLALFYGDQLLAVANSNRFNAPNGINNIAVLDVRNPAAASVLAKAPSAFTSDSKSGFPRDVTVGTDGATLFVPNYAAKKLQVIKTQITTGVSYPK